MRTLRTMPEQLASVRAMVTELVGDQPGSWDVAQEIPPGLLRKLGAAGVLCAQVPAGFGGLGASSLDNGELTAYVGSLCSSLRSVMTSQGMAAWTIQRFGDRGQRVRLSAPAPGGGGGARAVRGAGPRAAICSPCGPRSCPTATRSSSAGRRS